MRKNLKVREKSTIRSAVESATANQQSLVPEPQELAEPVAASEHAPVPAVEEFLANRSAGRAPAEKPRTADIRLTPGQMNLIEEAARDHNVAMKSFVLLSALAMRDASPDDVVEASMNLSRTELEYASERMTLKCSPMYAEAVLPDLTNRFNGNTSQGLKAWAAHVANLPREQSMELIRGAIKLDLRRGYHVTAPFRYRRTKA